MGFATALSGLKAASSSLQVTGNNIANSQTTGFKESRAEFADVYASSIGGVSKTQPGAGVRVTEVAQQFNQGNIEATQNSLDLAVSGNGFFVMADKVNLPDPANPNAPVNPSVPSAYTRNGAFQLDNKGNVVNSQGKYLLAFAPNGTTAAAGFSVGVFRPLTIDTAQGLPNATTSVAMKLNINGAASAPTAAVFDPTNPLSYNNTTSVTSYDTQGNSHIVSTYYVKTPVANAWDAYMFLDSYGITTGGGAVPPAAAPASTVAATLNTPGLPIPMTFTASGLLAEVGNRAASVVSAGALTAANTAVASTASASTGAGNLPAIYTAAATIASPALVATDAATSAANTVADTGAASADATNTAGAAYTSAGALTAQASAAAAALTAATADTNAAALSTAAAAANLSPTITALAAAYATAATNANTAAANYAAATPVADGITGTAAAALAATSAAKAVTAQTAFNSYNAAVAAFTASAKQATVVTAQSASTSATSFAAAASAVNSVPSAALFAASAKTTAATAAASAAAYATAAAAVVDSTTASAAAGLAATAAADAVTAQAAAVAYNNAVAAASANASPSTKVDFGAINLSAINPNISVAPMAFGLDFSGTTQFATPFSVNGLKQDGLPAGNLTGIDVDGTGVVFARYSNGGSKALGQVALARFQNNQALAKTGDTTWAQTSDSGQPIYGAAGDNNFGAIQSSALEGSNVDLSAQLVKLIVAQQAYQADSQAITTEKTLLETILRA
ncbi:flagellar hook-basal body complex protein [Methylobacter sp.]|uniref:flagellar hook-basal body complex protein n=1 Tax=Methylobacter sp. TaxID=2051955 RepID=UPI00248955B1|nr:flagellar hook-basal body complex protein [Methylobacter sp.]MDI1277122.1 flagellar hook-basal body complex protein [Methylobacter sp.]MDI1357695.1 flagellar hook-basal body complex protein [Methylobacter sp.]